jgi:branched-subunit amino acid aminotransferase/4-amino-4-deoxychorismate lyase
MPGPFAYLNGRLVPADEAVIRVTDAGFVLGATVSEQLRTFGGRLFRLDDHLARLRRSLEIVGVELSVTWDELAQIATDLAGRNHALLDPADDLGLAILVTPGEYAAFAPDGAAPAGPTLCLHTYPLPFGRWAAAYESGVGLRSTEVRQVPGDCWPAELKCRSRMHYYLADKQAAAREPGARALLLDAAGRVTETATANVLIVREGRMVSPPRARILPGISLATVRDLAAELGIGFDEQDLRVEDVATADEVLLCSTPSCLLGVTRFNGRTIGAGAPSDTFRRVLLAWSKRVGIDIAGQAVRFSRRQA